MHEADKRAGRAIKTRREELEPRITQEELAFRAEVSPSLITKLERGSQPITQMKAVNLFALIAALNWTYEEFTIHTGVELPIIAEPTELKRIPLQRIVKTKTGQTFHKTQTLIDIPTTWSTSDIALLINENSKTLSYVIYEQIKGRPKLEINSSLVSQTEEDLRIGELMGSIGHVCHMSAIDGKKPETYIINEEAVVETVKRFSHDTKI